MRHAIEEEEKIPLEQVTNFNEVCFLHFLVIFLSTNAASNSKCFVFLTISGM